MTVSTRAAARRLRATALTAVFALVLLALQVAYDGAARVRPAEGAPTVLKTISGVIITSPLSFATIATTAAPTTTAAPVLAITIRTISNIDLSKDLAGLITTAAPTTTAAPVLAITIKTISNIDLSKDLAGLITTTAATTTTVGSKIVSLTPTQIKALDGATVGTLSPAIISQLSPTQLAALTEVTGTVAPTTTTLAIRTGGLLLDPSKILAIVPRDALAAAVSMTTTTVKGKSVKLDSAVLTELKGVLAAAIGTTTTVRSRVTTKAVIDKAVLDKGVVAAALRTTTTARSGVSIKSIPTKITAPDKGVSIKSIPIKITAPDRGGKVPIKITIPDRGIKPGKVPPVKITIPGRIPPIKGGGTGKSIPGVIIANPCLSAAVAAGSSARAAAAAAAVSKTPITVAATLSPAAASKLKVVGKDPCGGASGAGASGSAGDPCNPGASGATPAATAPGKAKAAAKSGKDCTATTAAAGATTTVKGATTTVAAQAGAAGGAVAPATEVPPGISMRMVPDVAGVGKVSTVVGAGFTPGAQLQLAWSDGEAVGTVTADELGTFSFGVLLLPGAATGNRTLQVVNDPALAALSADLMVLGSTGGGSSGRSSALMKR